MIIVNKISIQKWKRKKNKYTDITIYNIINIIFDYLYSYIINNKELKLQIDKETFYNNFIKLIYNEYVYPIKKMKYICSDNLIDNTDYLYDETIIFVYFESKYSEDIIDIFLYFKDITYNYNFNLFHNKNNSSYPLLEFLFYNCDITDPYINEEIDTLEEYINIYE